MTQLQEVLLECEQDYMGHPYFVSGHALYTALARQLPADVCRRLQVSRGVFVPAEYGSYPEAHSQSGGVPYMGTGLRPVEAYDDLFLFRDPAQRWLSDMRPRDAHNTHGLAAYGRRTAYRATRQFGLPETRRADQRTMTWYVHCYLHVDGWQDAMPLEEAVLDGLRVGGGRNFGLGETTLADTQLVDLEALDYGRIKEAPAVRLELLSPYVLASEYPGADGQDVPWWWACDDGELRRRTGRLVKGDDTYELETVDHGQVVEYAGESAVTTAKNGILRVGTHSQYGFGEFRVRPVGEDRVPERNRDGSQQGEV